MAESIIIYLLIGFGSWAAHVLQCDNCHRVARLNLDMIMEGSAFVFAWPLTLITYISNVIKRPTTGLTFEEVEKQSKESVEKFFKAMGGEMITIDKLPGETEEAFSLRAAKILREKSQERNKQKESEI